MKIIFNIRGESLRSKKENYEKAVFISEEAHREWKTFCKENKYKISRTSEFALKNFIENPNFPEPKLVETWRWGKQKQEEVKQE